MHQAWVACVVDRARVPALSQCLCMVLCICRVLVGGWLAMGIVYGIGRLFNVQSAA